MIKGVASGLGGTLRSGRLTFSCDKKVTLFIRKNTLKAEKCGRPTLERVGLVQCSRVGLISVRVLDQCSGVGPMSGRALGSSAGGVLDSLSAVAGRLIHTPKSAIPAATDNQAPGIARLPVA